MIVGAYTLDLYCENYKSLDGIHEYNEWPHQFVGNDKAEAFRDAKRHGWRIDYKNWKCYCPKCSKK